MQTIDLDLLRSFVAFHETGSLARAADRVGRTESAVSLQMKRLEDIVNQHLMERLGRRLFLTEEGYGVLHYARQMLAMNDDLLSAVRQRPISGRLRVAASQDFGEEILPSVLKDLVKTYPNVRFEVEVEGGLRGLSALEKKEVDVVLTIGLQDHPSAHTLQRAKLAWIASSELAQQIERPVPLVVFNQPCRFKQRAMEALDHAGIPWEIVFRSPSLTGLWAAARANLGVTVRSSYWIPKGLEVLDPKQIGLPDLGDTEANIHYFEDALSPEVLEMVKHIERSVLLQWNRFNAAASLRTRKPRVSPQIRKNQKKGRRADRDED
jgi:DNA-binding transcriptional LysR family regulator